MASIKSVSFAEDVTQVVINKDFEDWYKNMVEDVVCLQGMYQSWDMIGIENRKAGNATQDTPADIADVETWYQTMTRETERMERKRRIIQLLENLADY
jgi:hypothetical protein